MASFNDTSYDPATVQCPSQNPYDHDRSEDDDDDDGDDVVPLVAFFHFKAFLPHQIVDGKGIFQDVALNQIGCPLIPIIKREREEDDGNYVYDYDQASKIFHRQ